MSPTFVLPMLEVLFFNLFTIHHCCHKKYPVGTIILSISIFPALFLILCWLFPSLPFRGDGSFSIFGFIYLLPLNFLYKENFRQLFVIICTCWIYTLRILSLSTQITSLAGSDNLIHLLIVENILFLITIFYFYNRLMPKYIFILENSNFPGQHLLKYLILNNCFNYLALHTLNVVFSTNGGSLLHLITLIFLLTAIFVSYFILYKVVTDSLKIHQLEQEVTEDPLTGLGNRTQLWNHLQLLLNENQTFSILFMDLDNFKKINDHYGHLAGDEYLKYYAHISSGILQNNGMIYRFGGDEFVVLYYGTLPQSVFKNLTECPEWSNSFFSPFKGVSTGLLLCKPPHKDAEQILHQVDAIMYQTKLHKRTH